MESLVTALVDMYPTIFRKKNRRETLILLVSVLSYLVGLVMLTEVFWDQTACMMLAGSECLPGGGGGTGGWWGPCWGQELVGDPKMLRSAGRRLPFPPCGVRIFPSSRLPLSQSQS